MKHLALFIAILISLGAHWAAVSYVPSPFQGEVPPEFLPQKEEALPVELVERPIEPPEPPPKPEPPPEKEAKPLPPPPSPAPLTALSEKLEELSLGRRRLSAKIPVLSPPKESAEEEKVWLGAPESSEFSTFMEKVGKEAGPVGEEEGRQVALMEPVLRDLGGPSREMPEDSVRGLEDELLSREFEGLSELKPRRVTEPELEIRGPAAARRVIYKPAFPDVTLSGEGEIALKFWVLPDGTVGRVVPFKKGEARLEAMAIQYLKRWRFSPLPSDAKPREEWGIIPFKFVIR